LAAFLTFVVCLPFEYAGYHLPKNLLVIVR
jgi:hypothetical protein